MSIPGILNLQKPNVPFHLTNLGLDIQRVLLGTQLLTVNLLHLAFHIPDHFPFITNIRLKVMFLLFQLLLYAVLQYLVGGLESCDLCFDHLLQAG